MTTGEWTKSSFCNENWCVEVRIKDSGVEVKDDHNRTVVFSWDEWSQFIMGVKDGQFDRETLEGVEAVISVPGTKVIEEAHIHSVGIHSDGNHDPNTSIEVEGVSDYTKARKALEEMHDGD